MRITRWRRNLGRDDAINLLNLLGNNEEHAVGAVHFEVRSPTQLGVKLIELIEEKTTLPGSQARTYLWQHQLGSIGLLGDQIVPTKEQTRHPWSSSLDAHAVFLLCGNPRILSYDNKTGAKKKGNFQFNPWTRKVKDAQTKSNFFLHNP